MSYQFYNDTATLKFVENGQAKNLSKSLVSLTVQGDDLVIGYDGNENWLRIAYTLVTVPSSASAEDLRSTLNGYLPEAVVATVDTSGLATASNQTDGSQKTKIYQDGADVSKNNGAWMKFSNDQITKSASGALLVNTPSILFDGTDFTQLKINGVAATDNYDLFNQFIALL